MNTTIFAIDLVWSFFNKKFYCAGLKFEIIGYFFFENSAKIWEIQLNFAINLVEQQIRLSQTFPAFQTI